MTGQNPARVGITSPACHIAREVFEATAGTKAQPRDRAVQCGTATRLKREYYTLAESLHDRGYVAAHFGKWHLGLVAVDRRR